MYYIYQRISTEKQSLIRQEGEINQYCKDNGIIVPEENVFSDVITGKTIKRDNYQAMKRNIGKGDTLIILDLDRLGRDWDIIKTEWKELTDKGVNITIVNCPLLNVMPDSNGKVSIDKRLIQSIVFDLLCYLSQKEVEKLSKRTIEGIKARKELLGDEFKIGRPRTIEDEAVQKIYDLRSQGKTYDQIVAETGVSKGSVCRILKRGESNGIL